ncbi:ATP-binding protein [Solirubrobacter soli]|uniref:ATP-binding protein n=1 Tax=Solirubrobacter soli TaxID=363832 RepID=UPI0004096935|nr:ATP-binding protein [Solirubrobacter soli]
MNRLAIRVRVTLAFAIAMIALFTVLALVLEARVTQQVDDAIDDGLRARATDVAAGGAARFPGSDARFTEVLPGGTPYGPRTITRTIEGEPTRMRVLAIRDGPRLIVVGQSLEARDEALNGLKGQLALGLPLAVLAACVAGYFAAAGALRPVTLMTRRAREISAGSQGTRLPVPDTHDEISDLGTTLNAMLERLEQTLEHERAFVADASHELRTPLTTIGVELDVALRTASTEDEFRSALETAARENKRIVALAEDLLVLARADQGRLPMRPETVDIGAFVGAAATRVAARAEEAGLTVECHAGPDLFAIADELRLDQLLDNLTDNALRYALSRIMLVAERQGAAIAVRVSDDGPGFPPQFARRAFDRFTVADDARTGTHTGLGLAIVDAVAQAHGWTATIRGDSTVEIMIPALNLGIL